MKEIAYERPPLEKSPDVTAKASLPSKGSTLAPTLRTFQGDATKETTKTTKLAMMMAERTRREERGLSRVQTEESGHNLGRTIFLLLLVLAFGIGVGIYALIGAPTSTPSLSGTKGSTKEKEAASSDASIAIGHSSREEILSNVSDIFAQTKLAQGDVRIVKIVTNDTADNTAQDATASAVLRTLGVKAPPETLLRSLADTQIYGIYSATELVGFFKLRSRSYPETFAGMLKWEEDMGGALTLALNPKMKKSDADAFNGRAFRDERIAGIPTRVLSDPDGETSIVYAFPDKKTLLIAGDRETLRMLIETMQEESK